MMIGDFDTNGKAMIVAEIGNNHQGSYTLAEEMIGRAAEAGADAVKFQTFRTELYVSSTDRSRFEMLKQFELTEKEFKKLKKVSDECGVVFLSTPFDIESAKFLNTIVPAFKIASGDNTFYPLIDAIAGFGKPIILSSGLADLPMLLYTKSFIEQIWNKNAVVQNLVVLHCVCSYPVPPDEANLAAIRVLRKELGCDIGYSDHTFGVEAAAISVALGAKIVEKHFTLDKNYSDFRDHKLSADPQEMRQLVERIRFIETLMGSGEKMLQPCEKAIHEQVRRSIAAVKNLKAGHFLQIQDITWVRPAGEFVPGQEAFVLGKSLKYDVPKGEPLRSEVIE